jgi:hypothetical protein
MLSGGSFQSFRKNIRLPSSGCYNTLSYSFISSKDFKQLFNLFPRIILGESDFCALAEVGGGPPPANPHSQNWLGRCFAHASGFERRGYASSILRPEDNRERWVCMCGQLNFTRRDATQLLHDGEHDPM